MIRSVGTNLKVGADVKLGSKTLIVGPKGSGKSTIVNAIELALTGRCGDVAGRDDVGSGTELWTLAPEGHDEIHANVEWTEPGAISSWSMEQGKKPVRAGPVGILPLREVREALVGSAETTRKWLLQFVGGRDWRTDLGGGLAARAAALPDDLAVALEGARQRGRESRAAATRLRNIVKAASTGLAPEPSDGEIIAARTHEEAIALSGSLATVRARKRELLAEREVVAAKLGRARTTLDATPAIDEAQANQIDRVLAAMEVQIAVGATRCAVCGATDSSMLQRIIDRRDRLLTRARDVTVAATARREAAFAVGAAEADLARIEASLAALPAEIEDLVQVEPPRTSFAELQSLRAKWHAARNAEKEAVAADREADEWQAITDLLSRRLAQAVEDGRAAFEARVQKYLPPGMVFGLSLTPVRVGLRRGEALHTALSGAEWATVTLALALAASEDKAVQIASALDSVPIVAIPEERAFDRDTLRDVLAAWADAPVQIVMTSPIMPSTLVKGWTVITRGAGEEATNARIAAFLHGASAEEAALADPPAANLSPTDLGPTPLDEQIEVAKARLSDDTSGEPEPKAGAEAPRKRGRPRRKGPPPGANGQGGPLPPTDLS